MVNVKLAAASWNSDGGIVEVTEMGFVCFSEIRAISIFFFFFFLVLTYNETLKNILVLNFYL